MFEDYFLISARFIYFSIRCTYLSTSITTVVQSRRVELDMEVVLGSGLGSSKKNLHYLTKITNIPFQFLDLIDCVMTFSYQSPDCNGLKF